MNDTPNDMMRQDAPQRDEPRQPASIDPAHFTMTVEDASARFADAGLPRSTRSIQRYCQRGHLSCTTVDTEISEMYLIDADSVERRIKELQQIEFVTRAPGVSRQDAPRRDMSRHDATVRDTPRQEVSSDKIDTLEKRIKELEYEKMQIEIDKRAKEFVINQLTEDRKNLFGQMSDHIRTITDQARIIGQLETRLELAPGRIVQEEPAQQAYREPPVAPAPERVEQRYMPPVTEYRRPPEPPQQRHEAPRYDPPQVEYPPRYGDFKRNEQGDNPSTAPNRQGV